ncbi:disease resistance protein RPV1 isoform X2 [Vitis vinifera]|uniref:disease resistance protein RPV1 isoform X2 n=1 Tax=Vitis vinifera TaxID=29760 RepID=UPI00053F9E81|nr:disease resistance protein RPV1 isoform X2 [Vitis vinifera]
MASAAASSSSSQTRYDVFLSFRGEDTRNNFTAHLYHALCQKGINTFIDDDKLERGQVISPALVAAIENSMFSIVVLSKNYAFSRWCLQELVKIVECMKSRRQRVVPIFYNVDPSDVRRQRGIFGEALAKHEENSENMERVQSWKDALTQVANLSGWDSRNKNEPLLIKEIVTDILNKLLSTSISDTENLVGIDARMQEIEMRLCLGSDDFLMVGIWGMGGIGKTTLARAIYRKITCQFEACCFFENVGEDLAKEGLIGLQQKFLAQLLEEPNLNMKALTSIKGRLHSKKVLIVLDNVNDPIILKCLVGNYDWFGRGSRIIITTRDKRLLISHGVLNYYEAQRFNYDEASEFLTPYSLKHKIPCDDFMEVSKEVIGYAQGLPLALEVLGSFLFSMTKEEWRNQLDKLKSTPNMKIQEVLKVSYDGLDDKEKNILLDIACFFKGEDKDYVMEILDGCGFFSLSGIRALIDKSLVTISWSNEIMMHDLIQEMGREIVRQQSLEEPGKRSRLWFHEDINGVLKKNTATEKIEGIFLNLSHLEEMLYFTTQALAGMNRLRLLKVYNSKNISRNFKDTSNMENCKVNFSKDFKFCYHDLRCLYFYGYSLKSLPNDFNPKNLVELSMPYSRIKQLWKGIKVPVVKPDTALAVLEASNPGIRIPHRASYQRIDPVVKLGIATVALKAFIPGSRIPDWIRYQSSGSEVKAELPPNWFNSNFLGFAFSFVTCGHFSCLFMLKADVLFDWTSRDDSSSVDIIIVEMISFKRRLETDHVCLCYVPLPQLRNCSQVTHIKVSFMAVSREGEIEIKRCGVGVVYSNEDGNHNNPPMIRFNSISSPPPPPRSKSTVVLEEIHEEEPSGNGCSNVDGSEEVRRNLELLLSALRIGLNQIFGHRNA